MYYIESPPDIPPAEWGVSNTLARYRSHPPGQPEAMSHLMARIRLGSLRFVAVGITQSWP